MRSWAATVLAAVLAAVAACETSPDHDRAGAGWQTPPTGQEPAPAQDDRQHEARANQCIAAKDWECAAVSLRAAEALGSQPLTATRARLVASLEAEARSLEKAVEVARRGRDRLVAAQDAAAAWTLWSEVSGKALPASARRVSRVAAKEERAAAQKIPRTEGVPVRSFAPARECCKHCTTGCPCGDSCISCSKTCHEGPGCAC